MGRGKVQLEFITKERSRRTVFERRKKGLMKKAEQFSILCGVDTCMVIYDPDDCSGRGPTIWPQDRDRVKRVIDRYLSEGVDRRTKRAVALPEFFMGRKRKLENEIAKVRADNWAAKYPVSDELIKGLSQDQLGDLLSVLQVKLETAKKRLIAVKENTSKDAPRMETEDLEFNSSMHSHGQDQMLFGHTNIDAPYLPPQMDPSYSSMMWSPSQAADFSASCCSSNSNHQDHNNYYYCSSSLAVPTYNSNFSQSSPHLTHQSMTWSPSPVADSSTSCCSSTSSSIGNHQDHNYYYNSSLAFPTYGSNFSQSSPYLTHQSRMTPTDQYYNQMQGGLRVQETTTFDSSWQHGMPGSASAGMSTMLPLQQQQLIYPYPIMQQGDTYYSSQYMPPSQEVQLDNDHSSSSRFFIPGMEEIVR